MTILNKKKIPNQVQAQISQLERMRSDFIANLSHELRTPLTVIQGYLETLIEYKEQTPEPLQKIIQQMHEHSTRMSDIITDLLLLSNLEHNEHAPLDAKKVDMANLLTSLERELAGTNEALLTKHNIQFEIEQDLTIDGRAQEIKSLLTNLATNAIKYTPAKGRIDIRWFSKEQSAILEIQDNGIGIEQEHLNRITERFYRVDKARSRISGGTGLGLSIVKHILIRHRANLDIQSTPAAGSLFRCTFPKAHLSNETPKTHPPKARRKNI